MTHEEAIAALIAAKEAIKLLRVECDELRRKVKILEDIDRRLQEAVMMEADRNLPALVGVSSEYGLVLKKVLLSTSFQDMIGVGKDSPADSPFNLTEAEEMRLWEMIRSI